MTFYHFEKTKKLTLFTLFGTMQFSFSFVPSHSVHRMPNVHKLDALECVRDMIPRQYFTLALADQWQSISTLHWSMVIRDYFSFAVEERENVIST